MSRKVTVEIVALGPLEVPVYEAVTHALSLTAAAPMGFLAACPCSDTRSATSYFARALLLHDCFMCLRLFDIIRGSCKGNRVSKGMRLCNGDAAGAKLLPERQLCTVSFNSRDGEMPQPLGGGGGGWAL